MNRDSFLDSLIVAGAIAIVLVLAALVWLSMASARQPLLIGRFPLSAS